MSEKQKFEELLSEIRSDLKYIQELQPRLNNVISNFSRAFVNETWATWLAMQAKEFANDVYLDKVFETDSKVRKFINELGLESSKNRIFQLDLLKQNIRIIVSNLDIIQDIIVLNNYTKLAEYRKKHGHSGLPCRPDPKEEEVMHQESSRNQKIIENMFDDWLEEVNSSLNAYANAIEEEMVDARKYLYDTDWSAMKKVKLEDYVLSRTRARYVSAREELEKAKRAIKEEQWKEILNHLRPAIDIALREKFGFKKIYGMKQFLLDADKFRLPLPSYTMLYHYFDEGSQRIHEGKLNTPFECQKALEFVAEFIDRLEASDIPREEIEKFKGKSKTVQ
jgi:hypothetical protein